MASNGRIILTPYEIVLAAGVGVRRRTASIRLKNKDHDHFSGSGVGHWDVDIEGALAELAFAKHMDLYWDGSVNTGKAADVGGYQVRHTLHEDGCLIVRQRDSIDDRYALVTGNHIDGYLVRGWRFGYEATTDDYLRNPGNKEPAWFVPQSDLWVCDGD